jgi:geranylgeranyl diphosphate synthase type II
MALEMVHTYSLIHDDLPSMDNDDLRRGQPTNHKVYGEATAILAGDGLLTAAFEVLAKEGSVNSDIRVNWVQELSEAAGMQGMVLGQQLDMDGLKDASLEDLENLHRRKTGALLAASVVMGAMTAQAPQSTLNILREFALDMGLAFQIRDDILDVIGGAELGKPVLSDEKNQKATYVSLLGLEKAQSAGEGFTEDFKIEKGQAFWEYRPFSRILHWGRDYKTACQYLLKNTLENQKGRKKGSARKSKADHRRHRD